MTRQDYPDAEMMMMDVADTLASELKSALLTHDRITFAVPGGTTPGPIFDTLSAVRLDWARVTVLPTDERWVPPDHARSNARLIRERLLTGPAAAAAFQPLYAEGSPEEALPALSEEVAALRPVNVMLLGMGADMHTASLFPGAEGLEAALDPQAGSLAVLRPEGEPEARVTLTAREITGAMSVHIVITGEEKRRAAERAARLSPREAPVHIALAVGTLHWAP